MPLYAEGFIAFPQLEPMVGAALYHVRQNRRGKKRLAAWGSQVGAAKMFRIG